MSDSTNLMCITDAKFWDDGLTNSSGQWGTMSTNAYFAPNTQWHYWYPWKTTEYIDRKIRVKLSELDTLRKAAKGDDKLKEVLKKFTPLIEVEVDL